MHVLVILNTFIEALVPGHEISVQVMPQLRELLLEIVRSDDVDNKSDFLYIVLTGTK